MTLRDRIELHKMLTLVREGKKPEPRREPEWMRRRREVGLPAKELTLS